MIVISGSQDQAAQSRARQAGANDFISKSADAPDVLSRIEEMLRSVKPNPRPEAAAPQLAPAQASATQEIATIQAAAQQPAAPIQDPLTGTLTSASLLGEARKQFSHARRHSGQLSIMAFRVDSHAEAARDAGKEVSDQVLARIAKMIQGTLRTEDSFGRVAEATFMVISAGVRRAADYCVCAPPALAARERPGAPQQPGTQDPHQLRPRVAGRGHRVGRGSDEGRAAAAASCGDSSGRPDRRRARGCRDAVFCRRASVGHRFRGDRFRGHILRRIGGTGRGAARTTWDVRSRCW